MQDAEVGWACIVSGIAVWLGARWMAAAQERTRVGWSGERPATTAAASRFRWTVRINRLFAVGFVVAGVLVLLDVVAVG